MDNYPVAILANFQDDRLSQKNDFRSGSREKCSVPLAALERVELRPILQPGKERPCTNQNQRCHHNDLQHDAIAHNPKPN